MSNFKLTKPIVKPDVQTGTKLSIGSKLEPSLLSVRVNTGKGMALHDSTYTKTCANIEQGKTVDLLIKSNAVTDKSGNGNHPTSMGSHVTLSDGELRFTPSGQSDNQCYLSLPNTVIPTGSFSLFFKCKFYTNGSEGWYGRLIDGGETASPYVYLNTDGKINVSVNGAYPSSGFAVTIGKTYDIIVTVEKYSGSNFGRASLYFDGVFIQSAELAVTYALGSEWCLGNSHSRDRSLNWSLYAYRQYDYALSASEALALSNGRTALYPSQDSLGFTNTMTTVKDLQWFVRNPTSTIEVAPSVKIDEVLTNIIRDRSGAGDGSVDYGDDIVALDSENKVVGNYSITHTIKAGTNRSAGLTFDYGTNTDISAYDRISFRLFGASDGSTWEVGINHSDYGGSWQDITEDWTGWKTFHFLLRKDFASTTLTTVRYLRFLNRTAGKKLNVDRVILDVCPSDSVKKLTLQDLYLENQLEESPDPTDVLEICDDDQAAFWNKSATLTLSNEATIKQKGTDALKAVLASGSQYDGIWNLLAETKRVWSTYDFISFPFYGNNNAEWQLVASDDTNDSNAVGSNWSYYNIPAFTGYRRLVIPVRALTVGAGTLPLGAVRKVMVRNIAASPTNQTVYVDRMVLQKGRWAYVEVGVPDTLYRYSNNLRENVVQLDWSYWLLYCFKVSNSTYYKPFNFDVGATSGKVYSYSPNMYFLNENTARQCYDSDDYNTVNSGVMLFSGKKGETKTRTQNDSMANQSITYNGIGGCKRRIGFALKMPPSDGRQSSTYGISQAKLKLEVYAP